MADAWFRRAPIEACGWRRVQQHRFGVFMSTATTKSATSTGCLTKEVRARGAPIIDVVSAARQA
eukprot:10431582-Lingulodinium_polyedra.AAC.1